MEIDKASAKAAGNVPAQVDIDRASTAVTLELENGDAGSESTSTKQWVPIVTRQRVTRECWEAESDEVKAIVAAKRESLYQEDLAEWNERNANLESPEKQQVYVSC
jgi:hypothetical protein